MSYTKTASCVATAYTIRYGRANAGGGPGLWGSASVTVLGEGADVASVKEEVAVKGGGSIKVVEVCGTIGSGNSGISSLADEVSIVMWLVGFVVERNVYSTGEHLTATEGFLWPGRWATGGLLKPARV